MSPDDRGRRLKFALKGLNGRCSAKLKALKVTQTPRPCGRHALSLAECEFAWQRPHILALARFGQPSCQRSHCAFAATSGPKANDAPANLHRTHFRVSIPRK